MNGEFTISGLDQVWLSDAATPKLAAQEAADELFVPWKPGWVTMAIDGERYSVNTKTREVAAGARGNHDWRWIDRFGIAIHLYG